MSEPTTESERLALAKTSLDDAIAAYIDGPDWRAGSVILSWVVVAEIVDPDGETRVVHAWSERAIHHRIVGMLDWALRKWRKASR